MKNFCILSFIFCSLFGAVLDVVIPLHQKDRYSAQFVINHVKGNIKNIGKVYIISKERLSDKAEWVDEALLPFNLEEIGKAFGLEGDKRCGWYFQQLIKFYASTIIEDLSDNFLILDGDTKPNHPMDFLNEDGKIFLDRTNGRCRCKNYYLHMNKILPDLLEVDLSVNPVVHHMVFSKAILQDLFERVEQRANQPFWKEFLDCVDIKDGKIPYMGASEYMIYYHFCKKYHGDKFLDRSIKIYNFARDFNYPYSPQKYDFVSVHTFL